MTLRFAFLSQGKLHLKSGDAAEDVYESPFVRGIRDRAIELHRRHSWKSGQSGERMIPRAALWGASAADPTLIRIEFNCVAPRGDGRGIVYSVISPEISGVLAFQEESGSELRLLHTADFRVTHVTSQPGTGRIAMSLHHRAGATLAVMESGGSGLTELTQGESFDEAPSWPLNGENKLIFQSAGVANNEAGQIVGLSPYAIQSLDLENSKLSTLLESPDQDFLAPRVAADGSLYFIRRPYRANRRTRGVFGMLEDILLFPYRLLYALFQYLNFFTMRYTGKPLSQSGPTLQKEADTRRMILWGNVVEAQRSLLGEPKDSQSLVPSNWELCRKQENGEIEVLAKSVASFDFDGRGGLLFTNGVAVFHLSPDGVKQRLHKGTLIQQVAVIPDFVSNEIAASAVATNVGEFR